MNSLLITDENAFFPYGVAVAEQAWQRYGVDEVRKQAAADPMSPRLRFARLLTTRMNETRDFSNRATRPARAGEMLAMMLLHEVFRYVVDFYCRKVNPSAIGGGLSYVRTRYGADAVDRTLPAFIDLYPPLARRREHMTPEAYLSGIDFGIAHKELAVRELLLLQIAHENPALVPYRSLFDNGALRLAAPYGPFINGLDAWFETQPPYPDTGQTLMAMLRAPILAHPDSIEAQLEHIMRRWHSLLPQALLDQLLMAQGALREETMMRGHGPGPIDALAFSAQDYAEPEAFSQDEDWMPHVVLIAKLAYVWLDQLSAKYSRRLSLLSDIPNEELDRLAGWGFNALWLIGVWERSPASCAIKQRMGNPEAASSAYSLYDYTIANDLGGEAAFYNLAERAAQRGIRLAGDMVPNHMGLYSKWMIEHPQRFLQLNESPFPNYRFTGPDLSEDSRVGLYIEDGYWNHGDAAVVFQRVDRASGDVRYIYHGNDGTSMPWNDTAQLNFLLQDTRDAVMETILHTARLFPIIRFDAAMTLAKRHYQRLWFPKPGDGGAVPSRAQYGMSRMEFDQAFPNEFWREVVDRIAAEAPNTLLLAEAFWLMEGYFVRTLGMHRVYNSAFMNMLKMEDNAKYRQTIKNVLEFSPEVLQRFVNFMNNPDEDTAEAQFGKDDKYFGVAALLATMPGLPMFGHGQIEGYTEKYGMEYRRAYRDETPDQGFIERHEREIFPLMRKRHLFSGARNFFLFDFVTPDGWVDENVYAYSNRSESERALIVYNNAYNVTRGVLHTSTAVNEGRGEEKRLQRRSLAEALALNLDSRYYAILRDERSGLEFLHHNRTLSDMGMHLELQPYQVRAFISIRQVRDDDHSWGRLHGKLSGRGIPSIEEAYIEMHLSGILDPFRELMTKTMLEQVLTGDGTTDVLGPWRGKLAAFLVAVGDRVGNLEGVPALAARIESELAALRRFMRQPDGDGLPEPVRKYLTQPLPKPEADPDEVLAFWRGPAAFLLLHAVGCLAAAETASNKPASPSGAVQQDDRTDVAAEIASAAWMREWLLIKHIARAFEDMNGDAWQAWQDARLAYLCVAHRGHLLSLNAEIWGPILFAMFEDSDARNALMVNRYAGRRWLNREQLDRMLYYLFLVNVIVLGQSDADAAPRVTACWQSLQEMLDAANDVGYDFDRFLEALK